MNSPDPVSEHFDRLAEKVARWEGATFEGLRSGIDQEISEWERAIGESADEYLDEWHDDAEKNFQRISDAAGSSDPSKQPGGRQLVDTLALEAFKAGRKLIIVKQEISRRENL